MKAFCSHSFSLGYSFEYSPFIAPIPIPIPPLPPIPPIHWRRKRGWSLKRASMSMGGQGFLIERLLVEATHPYLSLFLKYPEWWWGEFPRWNPSKSSPPIAKESPNRSERETREMSDGIVFERNTVAVECEGSWCLDCPGTGSHYILEKERFPDWPISVYSVNCLESVKDSASNPKNGKLASWNWCHFHFLSISHNMPKRSKAEREISVVVFQTISPV